MSQVGPRENFFLPCGQCAHQHALGGGGGCCRCCCCFSGPWSSSRSATWPELQRTFGGMGRGGSFLVSSLSPSPSGWRNAVAYCPLTWPDTAQEAKTGRKGGWMSQVSEQAGRDSGAKLAACMPAHSSVSTPPPLPWAKSGSTQLGR